MENGEEWSGVPNVLPGDAVAAAQDGQGSSQETTCPHAGAVSHAWLLTLETWLGWLKNFFFCSIFILMKQVQVATTTWLDSTALEHCPARVCFKEISGSRSVAPGPATAATRHLAEMWIIRQHPRPTSSERMGLEPII